MQAQALLEQSEIINSVRGVKVVGPIGSTFPDISSFQKLSLGCLVQALSPITPVNLHMVYSPMPG